MRRIGHLDGWRGLAIAAVLLGHFAGPGFPQAGRFGVDAFFVLSGLLMARILFEERTPLPTFYRRRAARILPAFLLYLASMIAYANAAGLPFPPREILAAAAFLRTYLPSDPGILETPVPIQHLWSLNVEEHAYLFLGLLALLRAAPRRMGWALTALGAAALGTQAWRHVHWMTAPRNYDLRTECASAGLLISAGYALLARGRGPALGRFAPWAAPTALALAALCHREGFPWWGNLASPWLLAYAVNRWGQSGALARKALEWAPLKTLGAFSYSIYLWQQPFYLLVREGRLPAPAGLAAALAIGWISFRAYEDPMRAWWSGRRPAAGPAADPAA
jgi:peptidoglycan/LPS O-acetylase OafA/YrhL